MKMRPPAATALASLLLALTARTAAAQPVALVTVLDAAGDVGAGSDVAYGPNGRALVSYLDATNGSLKVAACHDVACTSATLHTIDASGAVTGSTSIAFGPDGMARIAYQSGTAVRIARCVDAACSAAALATVDTVPALGPGTAVGVGGDGLPILAYVAAGVGLRVAHCSDGACSSATVTTYDGSFDVSLTIGGDGRALVATSTSGAGVDVYHCADAACTTATVGHIFGVPTGGPMGYSYSAPSLARRPDGTGMIAVTRSPNNGPPRTELFLCGNASCTLPGITSFVAGPTTAPALAVTTDDRVILAHHGAAPAAERLLALSCLSGHAACEIRTLDAFGVGRKPQVAVGPSGIGLVSYQNEATGDLRVAYLVDPLLSPVVTTIDAAGDVGRDSDVAFGAEGNGFVAYVDTTNGGLKVAACADLACTAADVRTIDADGPVASASLAIGMDGRPTIAYQHTPTASVRVAKCADAVCTSAAIETIDDLGALTAGTDVAIGADGLPFVVYGDAGAGTLKVAHCQDAGCTTRTITPHPDAAGLADRAPAALLGTDGLVVFASTHGTDLRLGHCSNPACTSATFTRLPGSISPPSSVSYRDAALALGLDGRPVVAYVHEEATPPLVDFDVELRRCVDPACSALETSFSTVAFRNEAPSLGMAPGDLPVVSNYGELTPPSPKLKVTRCTTPACPFEAPVVIDGPGVGRDHAMAVVGYGRALVSYYDDIGQDLKVAWLGAPPEISIGDVAVVEGSSGSTVAVLPVTITGPTNATVAFATAPGTATAPSDYASTAGTLTFTPAVTTLYVTVSVVPDTEIEPHETFFVYLSNPQGVVIVDAQGTGTILNDDPPNGLRVGDASAIEGSPGANGFFTFTIGLDSIVAHPVTVDFATADGTATVGVDYLPASGTLSFAPGEQFRELFLSALPDSQPEPDETFFVRLSNPQGAIVLDDEGVGTIVNDDEFPIPGELRHGTSYVGDLISNDAPAADVDDFRLAQDPYASYEVVVDAVSGDPDPLTLERRAAGGAVLQSGVPVGTGPAVALRWRVGSSAVTDETVRIAGACSAACGADDVYRVRAYETTLRAARFNNTGDQATVLVLSNPGAEPVALAVDFWGPDGTLLATHTPAGPLAPHGVLVLNTSAIAPGASGSLTVTHDAPYGVLAGKAVALEPSTGFSFDTPLEARPR
jgi:Calx-beta domain